MRKKLDTSNQLIEGYGDYIGHNEGENHILDKVCGDDVKDICSEKNEVYKNNSINRFIKKNKKTRITIKQKTIVEKSKNKILSIHLCTRYELL